MSLLLITILLILITILFFISNSSENNSSNKNKGELGEKIVSKANKQLKGFKSIDNITIKKENGYTTQIDHILFSQKGIFVIETKNYSGVILPKDDEKWIQHFPKKNFYFYNPIKQNENHRLTIKRILNIPNEKIHSIVVFPNHTKILNIEYYSNLFNNVEDYILKIKSFKKNVFTEKEVENHFNSIKNKMLLQNKKTEKIHIKNVDKQLGLMV